MEDDAVCMMVGVMDADGIGWRLGKKKRPERLSRVFRPEFIFEVFSIVSTN